MIRPISIIFSILAVVLIIIFFSLPSTGKVSVAGNIKSSNEAIYRAIINQQLWNKWFSGDITIKKPLLNSAAMDFLPAEKAPGNILLVPVTNDSTQVLLNTDLQSYNRITNFFTLKELQQKLKNALDSLRSFCTNTTNIYGIDIQPASTKDTFLITSKFTTHTYPNTTEIYSQINQLKKTAASANVGQAGFPMLNVTHTDSSFYQCMVALPINRIIDLPSFVRMVPGRFLTAEVKGGPSAIQHAHEMMQQYFKDYSRTSMAIPFEYLITDRSAEPDTSKWITKIYAPVY
ncbi:MAG: GyrI-like domain-containing protein [Chitinophagaceae bacterium]|nr:GyrI-like domain-containing protein [Chitinophagaceae bacterium]